MNGGAGWMIEKNAAVMNLNTALPCGGEGIHHIKPRGEQQTGIRCCDEPVRDLAFCLGLLATKKQP